MADKKYGKFGSSYNREISMHVVGKNLNDEQYAIVLAKCVDFKDKLMDALDDYNFDFPQSLETEITYSNRRGRKNETE